MRGRRDHWIKAGAATVALALLVVGAVVAQDPVPPSTKAAAPANPNPKAKATVKKGGLRLRTPGKNLVRAIGKAVDPLANPANPDAPANAPGRPLPPAGTFRYRFKIAVGDNEPLAAAYYPAKLGTASPVVMLVHERDRSSRDFEESMEELKRLSFAESLQKQGYAVLAFDLRGHGGSQKRVLPRSEWPSVVNDLQAAYYCLVDRHNWGELNLAKLGVIALGEGANVAVTWAAAGGAVSSEGRTSDLGALILVSPMGDAQAQGLPASPPINAMAARVPLALLVGERDAASFAVVDASKPFVKRYRSNVVETFPSALHGYKLLTFEPKFTDALMKFLETNVKNKGDEWDGRYLLTPVTYTDIKVIPHPVRIDPATKKAAQ